MISMPAWPASGASLATIPCAPVTARWPALYGHAAGNTAGRRSPEYIAGPRSVARRGDPTSVADGAGVCDDRQDTATITAATNMYRFMVITRADGVRRKLKEGRRPRGAGRLSRTEWRDGKRMSS